MVMLIRYAFLSLETGSAKVQLFQIQTVCFSYLLYDLQSKSFVGIVFMEMKLQKTCYYLYFHNMSVLVLEKLLIHLIQLFKLLAKMEAQVDTLCLLAQPKEGQQEFKNKKQPGLTGNGTVWKSDNQGDKDETFIHTSRRGGHGQLGWRGLAARQRLADPVR